jgi:flagellar FliL protein
VICGTASAFYGLDDLTFARTFSMADEPTPAADAAAPAKPKLPILIGMVAVGLLVGGATGAVFVGPMVAKKMGKATPVAVAAGDHAEAGAEGEAAAEGEHADGGEAPA